MFLHSDEKLLQCSVQRQKTLHIPQMNGQSKESYLILLLNIARLSQWNRVHIDKLIAPNFLRKLVEYFGIRWLRIQVFLDVTPCRWASIYRSFEGSCCLHLQGLAVQEEIF